MLALRAAHVGLMILVFGFVSRVENPEDEAVKAIPALAATAAGVPKYWGENRDYDGWFAALVESGVTAFLPYSAYQEVPETLSLGYEADFFPPCQYDAPAFRAMREHHVKLVVAGSLLYSSEEMPSLDDDPLRALLDCAGEGMIAAVYSIDEPAYSVFSGALAETLQEAARIYERVKAVAPDIPVMMVSGPIPSEFLEADGSSRPITVPEIDQYLVAVKDFSAYADTIAFDLYPIPSEFARVLAPGHGTVAVDYTAAFPAYLDWLRDIVSGKPYFLVLQAFSYEQQFSPELVEQLHQAGFVARLPTDLELRDMACLTYEGGASQIAWWGQSFLLEEDRSFWENVLTVTDSITSDPEAYCADQVSSIFDSSQHVLHSGRAA